MPRKSDAKLESEYQSGLIDRLEDLYPDILILKNDPNYCDSIPDLSLFWGPFYAFLEVKAYEGAPEQPNQRWYVERLNEWSFASFIYPENEQEVLRALQRAFSPRRTSRAV